MKIKTLRPPLTIKVWEIVIETVQETKFLSDEYFFASFVFGQSNFRWFWFYDAQLKTALVKM